MTTWFTHRRLAALLSACALVWPMLGTPTARAATPRALPAGQLPDDLRLGPLKDLDGYFPFTPPSSIEAWRQRVERVRRQMLVSLGLWPMPQRTPLNPVIHGRLTRNGYTVEKVYFESLPGFFVTGNLYRPTGRSGKLPGVLCPYGHWSDGRFMDLGVEGVRKQIVEGAERFEDGGRSPLQSRCVQLARMGCVVFHYDMIGYADSVQIPYELAHGFAKQRPEMNTVEHWGLFSPQAEAHLQSVMGLQTWDSIRALDFLLSLPEVDPTRVAVTGASGGGTQTFILCALDPRPSLAFPCVMVSTAMQGGCTCENACDLRIDTGNVEFAALFAPKPLGMTCAHDWTIEMSTKGFPQLQALYTLLGAPDRVTLKRGEHFEHNYNYVSRAAMYNWVNRFFQLGFQEPVVEEDHRRLTRTELTVWDPQHPTPAGGPEFERHLLDWLTRDAQRQLEPLRHSAADFHRLVGGAVDVLIGRNLHEVGDVTFTTTAKADRGEHLEVTGLLHNQTHHEELPVLFLYPKQWNGRTVLWVDPAGKAGLFEAAGGAEARLRAPIKQLLAAGATVVGVDLLEQGEFLPDQQPITQTRRVRNPREAAAYTFGYNRTLFAQRTQDLLTVLSFVHHHERKSRRVDAVGLAGAGLWVAAARALASEALDSIAIDTGGFRFGKVLSLWDPSFLPGGAKYGDLPGFLALGAPGALWLAGEGAQAPAVVKAVYAAANAADKVTVFDGPADQTAQAAVAWLIAAAPGASTPTHSTTAQP